MTDKEHAEILDAQAQPRDAERAQHFELRLLQRSRLALEGHFGGVMPGKQALQLLE